MQFDLHVHTTLSPCSQLKLDQILSQAPERGLDGVCITDHNSMDIRRYVKEGFLGNGLCVVFGMEYSTSRGDFLIFGPFEELPPGLPAQLLLKHVERSGGVAIAAHPFRSQRPTDESLIKNEMCRIVEGVNGRNAHHENESVLGWQKKYNIRQVGGSDAHSLEELGSVKTAFTTPIHSRTDLIRALKQDSFLQTSYSSLAA
ncbi:MAG: PHP domain-containing protein [Desulfobulbaceae bacterium]|uniref:PHP domain-containing protein n=1 Tax=Candidatus Desulfobia pelagia TaxID=2841692 RepID=A0A8J6NFF8_9BACT|nr:PHP domain-containing protein [Candidatus Desulfobia pelagia]